MADIYPTAGQPGRSGPQPRPRSTQAADRPHRPRYGSDSHAAGWGAYDEEFAGRSLSNPANDLVPVLGMLIGGVVGFVLATMIPSPRPSSIRSPGQRMFRGGVAARASGATEAFGSVEHDETTDLIASNKVEGTSVYNHKGERLGDVYNFMVGKRSGKVAYAVMSFGGFLGIGKRYHALPWGVLTYDTKRSGYLIDADRDFLMAAPHFGEGEDPFSRSETVQRIRDYWSSGRLAL